MAKNTFIYALCLAMGSAGFASGAAVAQSRVNTATINQNLYDLDNAQIEMQRGNAQIEADENARQRSLHGPEQSATAPGLESNDSLRQRENLNSGEPLLFDDHKDVRHDTDDLDRDR